MDVAAAAFDSMAVKTRVAWVCLLSESVLDMPEFKPKQDFCHLAVQRGGPIRQKRAPAIRGDQPGPKGAFVMRIGVICFARPLKPSALIFHRSIEFFCLVHRQKKPASFHSPGQFGVQ